MTEMLNGGDEVPPVQIGDADVVMIFSRSEDGLSLLLKFLFASVDQNFRTLLNLRFVGVLRDDVFETSNRLLERFRVHQLDRCLIRLNGAGKVFRADARR